MAKRIRYEFDGPIGISRQTYGTKNGHSVRIVVDKENFKFEIIDHNGQALVSGGNTHGNYIVLLRQAKRALVNLGGDFALEDRNRNYGIVRKD